MKTLILIFLLFISPLFAVEPWVRTHTPLRTLYVTPNSNFGKLLDSVTNNYMGLEDLARLNDITIVSGWQGNSLSITGNTCTGTCDEPYFRPKYVDTLDDTTWSVSWWFKSSAPVTGTMWAFRASTGPQLAAVVACSLTAAGQVSCLVKDDAATSLTLTSTGSAKDNDVWHHAMLVAEAGNIHRLYIDGALNVSNTSTTIGAKTEITMMDFNPNASSAYVGNYVGMIDEFHVYSDAKNLANAVTLYNAGTPHTTVLTNSTAVYHFNENLAAAGLTTDARIDFDEINYFMQPGDLVSAEVVSVEPDAYQSDRADLADLGQEEIHGEWYTISTSGTAANPIVIRCEGEWPSDCRFQSRIEVTGQYVWIWGMWITGVNGFNTQDCQTADDGGAGLSLEGIGDAAINNWIYHPAGLTGPLEGFSGAFSTMVTAPPAPLWYGNVFHYAGHGLYAQNNYDTSGYLYFVQNIVTDPSESIECVPGKYSVPNKLGAFWATNNFSSGMYIKNSFFADTSGRNAVGMFYTSDEEPIENAVVDNNNLFCGGAMVDAANPPLKNSGPVNGPISNGASTNGRPSQWEFTNNFAASCRLHLEYFWGTGEAEYNKELPNIFTGNTVLADINLPANPESFIADTLTINLSTSSYLLCDASCETAGGQPLVCSPPTTCPNPRGRADLPAADIFNSNTYATGATFELHAGGNDETGLTFAQWKTETAANGNAFDTNSSQIAYPTTGSRVVLYRNEYDTTLGNLMIYNWAEAASIAVNFNSVVPACSRFNLYNAHLRPDATPVLANEVNTGSTINVPMDGDLVRTFRIQIIN